MPRGSGAVCSKNAAQRELVVLLVLRTLANSCTQPPIELPQMGQVLSKVMLHAKTITKTLLERIWPLLQRGGSGSPSLPDLAGQHAISLTQDISGATTSDAPTAQAQLAPESIPIPEVSGPTQYDSVIVSESVRVPSPPTVFSTTESAIKDLAGRFGSDLLPALKVALAALVELAKSWDVRH